MTFTPQVLTKTDTNNSFTGTIGSSPSYYEGDWVTTTGYNTIILTIQGDVDSEPEGIQIYFSDIGGVDTGINQYSDTYLGGSLTNPITFSKSYIITKKYYKIKYTPESTTSDLVITSRLSTDINSNPSQTNSINAFDNNIEYTLDAFGKLRVSNPQTLLDIRFPGQSTGTTGFLSNNLQISTGSTGGYTGYFSNSKMYVGATGPGYLISQSRNYCVYQPGKSLLILESGILNPGNDDFTTRIGYFDNNTPLNVPLTVKNGLYFEYENGQISVNIKNNILRSKSQNEWNIDKMDGTGTSGITLDFSKTQLFVIDMEWLGVGRVRFGFYAFGKINYCHQFTNINELDAPYTNSINLPISYSIHSSNAGATGCTGFMQICSTVISEGGYNPSGRAFTISTNSSSISLAPTDGERILLAISGVTGANSNYYHQIILPTSISAISASTNDLVLYRLRLYRDQSTFTTSAVTWIPVDTNSVVQSANFGSVSGTTGGVLTNTLSSTILDEGYFFGRGVNSYNNLQDVFNTTVQQLTQNVNGIPDVLVLTCEKINNGSTNLYGSIAWQEIY